MLYAIVTCCLYVIYMLFICCCYFLFTCCLCCCYLLFTCCLYVVYMLFICCFLEPSQSLDSQGPVFYLFFVLWIVAAIVSTCYTFTWDVKMDWGLFQGKYKLREELIYPSKVSVPCVRTLGYYIPRLSWMEKKTKILEIDIYRSMFLCFFSIHIWSYGVWLTSSTKCRLVHLGCPVHRTACVDDLIENVHML